MGEREKRLKLGGIGNSWMNGALFTPHTIARWAGGGTKPRLRPPGQDSTGPPQRLPAPEKVLCKRNLYANVVLLVLRHPFPRAWGHLKMLSKALCRALTRAELPSPGSGPLIGLRSNWSCCFPVALEPMPTEPNCPPSRSSRERGTSPCRSAAGPTRMSLLACVFPGLWLLVLLFF